MRLLVVKILLIAWLSLCASKSFAESRHWVLFDQLDRIMNKREISIESFAIATVIYPNRRTSETDKLAKIRIGCSGSIPYFHYYISNQLVAGSTARVQYRVDDDRPVDTRRWRSSSDYTAIGLWNKADIKLVLKQISGKNRIAIRTIDNVFGVTESEFDISGLAAALPAVTRPCGLD
jgi:hypothetical protein